MAERNPTQTAQKKHMNLSEKDCLLIIISLQVSADFMGGLMKV